VFYFRVMEDYFFDVAREEARKEAEKEAARRAMEEVNRWEEPRSS
jgi:hypothetical protein